MIEVSFRFYAQLNDFLSAHLHLRKLASFLRLAGLDVIVLADDTAIADAGARDGRVVLTRDVGLLKRSIVRPARASSIQPVPEWRSDLLARHAL